MKVQTVLGPINPQQLGRTLTHEHMILDFNQFYRPGPNHLLDSLDGEVTLQNIGNVRQYPYSSKANLRFNGEDTRKAILNDVHAYKRYGGGTIVENTPYNLGPDVHFLKEVSKATGVHVVAGTAFYIADVQEPSTLNLTVEDMYDHMLKELTQGFDADNSVKAGFMGEIGSVWPIHDFEKRAIQAAAEVQQQVGCGVSFHPHRVQEAPAEIIRIFTEAGGKADKAIMSHLDRTIFDKEILLEFSSLGTYCQLDLFGVEVSLYQLNLATSMPSDAQRIETIKLLIDEGKEDKITISHDIHTRHRLIDFGGHGYSHIINNVLPCMRAKGISEEVIEKITIKNPSEWLQYDIKN